MENNLIQIKEYAKPKRGEGGGGSAKITYNIDGTSVGSNLKLKSLQVNRILADYIEANNFVGNTGNFIYFVASDGSISNLNGNRLEYNTGHIGELKADSIETDKLKVNDTATIKNIFNDYMCSREIVTDYLTVNKAAHFFEVVIDKIRSVGGTIINTATNCVIDYVEPVIENGVITGYKCYWKQTNNEDEYVSNDWLPNDQAISQNCNLVAGVNHNTSNHYYWRLVKETSNEDTSDGPIFVNFNTGESKFGTYDQEKQKYVAPEYEITFENFAGTDYIFKYDNMDEDPDYSVVLTDWNIIPQIDDTWDAEHNIFTVKDSLHGLQLIPKNIDLGNENYRYPNIRGGHLTFNTSVDTKLNVMIMYDNDTIEYHTANESGTSYDIEIMNPTNALVTMIVITSDVVDVWHACHWIVLGNGTGEVHVPTGAFGTEVANWDNIPAKGDNIAQLGYRYGSNATQDEISRASAIIIAAYKTPDSVIVPPSYAQYQNITDFNLSAYRGTYMDATGAYIKGSLVTESGSVIDITDDGLQINTNYYRLIPSENPIVKPKGNETKTITFTVFNVTDGVGTEMTSSELEGWSINVNGADDNIDVKQNENYFEVEIRSNTDSIEVKLYNENDILKDTYIGTAVNLEDVTDGKNGSWTQTIYQYVNVNSYGIIDERDQEQEQIPDGWYTNIPARQPANTYLWYATRLVTYDDNNTPVYGRWSTYRAQGLTGQQGSIGLTGEQGYQGEAGQQGPEGQQGQTGPQGEQGPRGRQGWDGQQGYQGEAGQSGQNGVDAEYYMLVPLRELFEVRLSGENMGTTAYTNITGDLYLDLIYAVAHVKGNVTTYLNAAELGNYNFNMISDNNLGNTNWTFYNGDSTTVSNITSVTVGNTSYDVFRINISNLLTWTNTYKPSGSSVIDSNYNNYYYLHANNQTGWMPTKINIRLLLRATNAEQDVRATNLSFKPSHVFSATDTALNFVYQGLSGTTGKWTTTGFSNIKQTWDNINMSVNNVKSLEYGTNIDNSINTSGKGLEQYAFYRTDSDTTPNAPDSNVSKTDSGNNEWTLYTLMTPSSSYKYIYISRRTRTYNATSGEYSNWSSWSVPVLYWVYNVPRTSINSAMLNIEADKIESKVTQTARELMPINLFTDANFLDTNKYWSFYHITNDANWIKGTYNVSTHNYSKGIRRIDLTGTTRTAYYIEQPIVLQPSTTYTLSCLYRDEGNSESPLRFAFYSSEASSYYPIIASYQSNDTLSFGSYDNSITGYNFAFNCPSSTTEYERRYVTFTTSSVLPSTPIYFWLFSYKGNLSTVYNTHIAELQLEEGDSVTKWTPNSSYNSSLITQTADSIKLEVTNDLNSTGIDIENGTITLNAENTNINGDLNLRGTFLSENTTTMNKTLIDSSNGGMTMWGPDHVNDQYKDLPATGASQGKIIEIKFGTNPDDNVRYGILELSNAYNNQSDKTNYINLSAYDGIEIGDEYRILQFLPNQIGYRWRTNIDADWPTDNWVYDDPLYVIGKARNISTYSSSGTLSVYDDMDIIKGGTNFTLPTCSYNKQITIFNKTTGTIHLTAPSSGYINGWNKSQQTINIEAGRCITIVRSATLEDNDWYIISSS